VARSIGSLRWAIAEGYITSWSKGPKPEMTSHETACLLNASDQDAHVQITIFFSDREPVGPYDSCCLRGERSMCVSTIWRRPNQFQPIRISRASSNLMSQSLCNTQGLTRVRRRTRCSVRLPTPARSLEVGEI
jgi:hypothetical protein